MTIQEKKELLETAYKTYFDCSQIIDIIEAYLIQNEL